MTRYVLVIEDALCRTDDRSYTISVVEPVPAPPRKTGLVNHLGQEIMAMPDAVERMGFLP